MSAPSNRLSGRVRPIFTEDARPRSAARFTRTLTALIVVLAVLCGLFVGLGYLQGPKLSKGTVDTDAVVGQSGQQLRLFVNQVVAPVNAKQVTITPNVAHKVTSQGGLIAVQFDARLKYRTDYHVRVSGVTSVDRGTPSTLEYSFTTGSPNIYYLDRGSPNDRIMRARLDASPPTVVYSTRRIQDFALLEGALAVVTLSEHNESSLDLVSLSDGAVEHVALPNHVVIQKVDAAAGSSTFGFTLTSTGDSIRPPYSSTLFTLDLSGSHTIKPVVGLNGKPLLVLDWEYMPDGSSLLALTHDRSLFMVDPKTPGSVLPLGQFNELGSISRDGKIATVSDAFGLISLKLDNLRQERLVPSPFDEGEPYLGLTEYLPGGERVEKLLSIEPDGIRFASTVALDNGKKSQVLYRTPNDDGSIQNFSVSPNGQYVAVEVIPNVTTSMSDGYYYDSHSTSTTTVFVDIDSGNVVKSVEGFDLSW
ncbi:MAG: hypothetical protein EPN91_00135 [Salinibacterium sp.]|nr:MAG: hypothetical protein EPN91_00135 [Salinibacterium sp.]